MESWRRINMDEVKTSKKSEKSSIMPILFGLVGVSLIILAFFGGIQYQKHNQKNKTNSFTGMSQRGGFNGGGGGMYNGQRPIRGTVSSVGSNSITISDRDGLSNTFSISSSTKITNQGQSANISDIKNGDTVMIVADSGNSKQANSIMINPVMSGRMRGGNTNNQYPSN